MPDGRPVRLYTLENKNGVRVEVSDLGATLVSVFVPDRGGRFADIVHGFDSAEGYLGAANPYFGATVGRFANRIAHGRFRLGDRDFELAKNNAPGGIPCHLHGGIEGFHTRLWAVENSAPSAITFRYISREGEEGYPGTLTATLTYRLDDSNELLWEAGATTDADTIVNIVHHPFWNLSGNPMGRVSDHVLTLRASKYLPTNPGLIPTGAMAEVAGTPMDFRKPKSVGAEIGQDFEPLVFGAGFDHCWVLDDWKPGGIAAAARLEDPRSGRVMEISTDQPGIHFYSGNFLDGSTIGKGGLAYPHRSALCLETENFPDAPNQPHFPSPVLQPGKTYTHTMIYKFSVA